MDEQSLFIAALEHSPPDRGAFLDAACGSNSELRVRVDKLLRVHEDAPDFFGAPAGFRPTVIELQTAECPGSTVGSYRIVEQIGEGGFGIVFLAEQERPIRRKVALKIIKPGMDSRPVIARFEAERQALALMDHPNIARVLDGGSTESGCPYFVMELVKGIPITQYCDQCNLTTRERLELFLSVCEAVQHAHQKGIIHRDIKPSNVMIAMQDGRPMAKVIDFGVAKALNQRLTEATVHTQFAQMIGTPLYMSPEQAEMSPLDVDVRSDIYSLGVLLYELLTGTTPFASERLKEATFDELRRIIREEDPAKPSDRLTAMGARATTVAEHRRTDARRLCQLVRRDLDWIVMKALEKDRTRRYDTASALATDLKRHLNDEPVQACPPSAAYKFQKFARRNRTALTTGALVLTALVLGTAVSVWQALRATEKARLAGIHEHQARIEADKARIEADIAQTTREMMASCWRDLLADEPDRRAKVHAILDRAAQKVEGPSIHDPLVDSALRISLAKMYLSVNDAPAAERHLASAEQHLRSLGDDPTTFAERQRDELASVRLMCRIQELGLPVVPARSTSQ
jgi:serine/threonine protein kinase